MGLSNNKVDFQYEIFLNIKEENKSLSIEIDNKYIINQLNNEIIFKLWSLLNLIDLDVTMIIINFLSKIIIISQNQLYYNKFNKYWLLLESKYNDSRNHGYLKCLEEIDKLNKEVIKLFYLNDNYQYKHEIFKIKNIMLENYATFKLSKNIDNYSYTIKIVHIIEIKYWCRLLLLHTFLTTFNSINIFYDDYNNGFDDAYDDLISILNESPTHDILLKNSNDESFIKIVSRTDLNNISIINFKKNKPVFRNNNIKKIFESNYL